MSELDLLEIAATWSFWDRAIPPSVPRIVDLPESLSDRLCLVIQGVRRCGKTTLLRQLIERYNLPTERCAFVNFEDPRLTGALRWTTLDRLLEQFRARHPDSARYYFLDEVQLVEGWQKWLRARIEQPSGDLFIIAGSNASLLSGELGSALTGRHLTVELYPFSLAELRSASPTASLEEYLQRGGFPDPCTMPDGDRLLRQYFYDIAERDIRERLGARSSQSIRQVVQMVFESAGSELSLRRIAGAAGIATDTAASYVEACERAYLLFSCPYFAFSERKRAGRNRKYYPIDTGLRRVVVTRGGGDQGKSLECAVHLALRQRFGQVFYWRERGEVDFVVHSEGRIVPVQVSWKEPAERHLRALEEFYERFPQADEALHITSDTFESTMANLARNIATPA